MLRRSFALVLLVLAAVFAVARPTPAAVAQPGAPSLTWTACAEVPDAECAFIQVPVDYARPDGATIALRLARLPALDPAQKRGVLLFVPGGPGVGVSDMFGEVDRRAHHVEEFRHRYDVVTFDPRGLGQSSRSAARPSSSPRRSRPSTARPRPPSSRRSPAPTRRSSAAASRRRAS